MPVELTLRADEKSTYIITADFTDEDDAEVTPTYVKWKLTTGAGVVVNDLEDQEPVSASSINIVLSGDDLQVLARGQGGKTRILTIEAIYDSITYGNDLPLNGSAEFTIDDFVAIA
jgi:hypothetical protein